MKGFIHIYCGDGKGKTTAATGLAVRMAGSGEKVLFVRFLKNENSCELEILKGLPGIEVIPCTRDFGFYSRMGEEQKIQAKIYYGQMLKAALSKVQEEAYGLLVLDEIIAACRFQLIEKDELIDFLRNKPDRLEVVLTGRNPESELLELADYITEMKKIKHPYDSGVKARKGVEY